MTSKERLIKYAMSPITGLFGGMSYKQAKNFIETIHKQIKKKGYKFDK
jgi:hypothetical protein